MAKNRFSNENKEIRLSELRAESKEEKMVVEGYACVFNSETLIGDEEYGWLEVVDRNAFDDTDMKDACLKYNHGDAKGVLARTRNGSMKLSVDDHGLKVRAELIDTTDNVDIYKCIKAGLLDKMSFAFTVAEEEIDEKSRPIKRTIKKIDKLWDCAVVDVPAYDDTEIYARSREIVGKQLKDKRSLENGEQPLDNGGATLDNVDELEIERLKARIKGGKF